MNPQKQTLVSRASAFLGQYASVRIRLTSIAVLVAAFAISFVVAAIVSFAGPASTGKKDVTIRLFPAIVTVSASKVPKFKATIQNHGRRTVTLVLPGDGSYNALRTPLIGWSILPEQSSEKHPSRIPPQPDRNLPDINPLTRSEVFTLKRSQSKSFDVFAQLHGLVAGRYRAVFYYVNDPSVRLSGPVLGKSELGAEELFSSSTRCELISNEVTINLE